MNIDNIGQKFSRAAYSYDALSCFQYNTAQKLVDRIITPPTHILDLGCGTGIVTTLLQKKFPNAYFTLVDIAPNMLHYAQSKLGLSGKQYILGSADDTPLIDHIIKHYHIDCVISNLCFQWLPEPLAIFTHYAKQVPVYISLLEHHSFYQWYQSVQTICPSFTPPIHLATAYHYTHNTPYHYKALGGYHQHYQSAIDFLRCQKKLGTLGNSQEKLSRKQLQQACLIFEKQYHALISYFPSLVTAKGPQTAKDPQIADTF